MTDISRRDLLKLGALGGATLAGSVERRDIVRVGIVGTGLRGRSVLGELLAIEGVRVTALADVVAGKVNRATKMIGDAGHPAPATFVQGDHGFEKLVARDDVDFVYTATPWEWHVPVMLAALAAGKHCGSEMSHRHDAQGSVGTRRRV